MSVGWQLFVFIITAASILGSWWFMRWGGHVESPDESIGKGTTGHTWDGDLEEYNNPLPKWWLRLFEGSIVFAIAYLILYPGSGIFDGVLGWSQETRYERAMQEAEARYGEIFAAYAAKDIPTLAQDPQAMESGFNLYGNNCAQCHGSDARGAVGFPNLTDDAWQWGGGPQAIKTTLLNGRVAAMPGWEAPLGGAQGVEQMAHYVLSLSGREHDEAKAATAEPKFGMFCAACHGPAGEGQTVLGAPNLTDDAWLYRPTLDSIIQTVAKGRNNEMPAFRDTLGEDRVHLLAAYVYGLSRGNDSTGD